MINRHHVLDALIVLVLVLAFSFFYLIEKIIEFCGNGDKDGKKNPRRNYVVAKDELPPTELPLQISMSGVCCSIQHLVKRRKGMKR